MNISNLYSKYLFHSFKYVLKPYSWLVVLGTSVLSMLLYEPNNNNNIL